MEPRYRHLVHPFVSHGSPDLRLSLSLSPRWEHGERDLSEGIRREDCARGNARAAVDSVHTQAGTVAVRGRPGSVLCLLGRLAALLPDWRDGWLSSDADAIPIPGCQRQSCGRRVHSWSASREIPCLPPSPTAHPETKPSLSLFLSLPLSLFPFLPFSLYLSLLSLFTLFLSSSPTCIFFSFWFSSTASNLPLAHVSRRTSNPVSSSLLFPLQPFLLC